MENQQQGWIKLHRRLLESALISKPEYLGLWVVLLLMANHEDKEFIFNNKKEICKRGQLITGRKQLAAKVKLSESKVERVLKYLEIEQQIEQRKTNAFRLITIINYDDYQKSEQQSEQPVDNQWTTGEQPVNTNKNEKNYKNDKNEKKEGGETPPTPKETMQNFFEMVKLKNDQYFLLIQKISQSKKLPPENVRAELDKFINYWREKNPNGTKERWQMQKVFEIQRRLGTWFSRANNYGGFQQRPKGITIIS